MIQEYRIDNWIHCFRSIRSQIATNARIRRQAKQAERKKKQKRKFHIYYGLFDYLCACVFSSDVLYVYNWNFSISYFGMAGVAFFLHAAIPPAIRLYFNFFIFDVFRSPCPVRRPLSPGNPVAPSSAGILMAGKIGMSNAQQFICDVNAARLWRRNRARFAACIPHRYVPITEANAKRQTNTHTHTHRMVYVAKKIIQQ